MVPEMPSSSPYPWKHQTWPFCHTTQTLFPTAAILGKESLKHYLQTNGVVITDAIKEKMMSKAEDNGKESEEPDYNEDKNQLEEK